MEGGTAEASSDQLGSKLEVQPNDEREMTTTEDTREEKNSGENAEAQGKTISGEVEMIVITEEVKEIEVSEGSKETSVIEEVEETIVVEEAQETVVHAEAMESVVIEEEKVVTAEVTETVVREETHEKLAIEDEIAEKASKDEEVKNVSEGEVQESVSAAAEIIEKVSDANKGEEIEMVGEVDERMGAKEGCHVAEQSGQGLTVEEKPLETLPTLKAEENGKRNPDEVDDKMGVVETKNGSVAQEQVVTAGAEPLETLEAVKADENSEEKVEVNDRMDTAESGGLGTSNESVENHVPEHSAKGGASDTLPEIDAVEISKPMSEEVDEKMGPVGTSDTITESVASHVTEQSGEMEAAELKSLETDSVQGEVDEKMDTEVMINLSVPHHDDRQPKVPEAAEVETTHTDEADYNDVGNNDRVHEKMDTEEGHETKDESLPCHGGEHSGVVGDAAEVEPLDTSPIIEVVTSSVGKDEQASEQMDVEEAPKMNNESFPKDGAEKSAVDVEPAETPHRVEAQEDVEGVGEVDDKMDTDEGLESVSESVPNHGMGQAGAAAIERLDAGTKEYVEGKHEVEDHMDTDECSEIQNQSATANHVTEHSVGAGATEVVEQPSDPRSGEKIGEKLDTEGLSGPSNENVSIPIAGEGDDVPQVKENEAKVDEVDEKVSTGDNVTNSALENSGEGSEAGLLETPQTISTEESGEGNHRQAHNRMKINESAVMENVSHLTLRSVDIRAADAEPPETSRTPEVEENAVGEIKQVEKMGTSAENSEGGHKEVDEKMDAEVNKSEVLNKEGGAAMGIETGKRTEGAEPEILSVPNDVGGQSCEGGAAEVEPLKTPQAVDEPLTDTQPTQTIEAQADVELLETAQTIEAQVAVEPLETTHTIEAGADVEPSEGTSTTKAEVYIEASIEAEAHEEALETTTPTTMAVEAHVEPLETSHTVDVEAQVEPLETARTVEVEAPIEALEMGRTTEAEAQVELLETPQSIEGEENGEAEHGAADENTGTAELKVLSGGNHVVVQSGEGGFGSSESFKVEVEAHVEPSEIPQDIKVEARVESEDITHKIGVETHVEPLDHPHKIEVEAVVEPAKTSQTSEAPEIGEEGHDEMDIDEDSRPKIESVGEQSGAAEAEPHDEKMDTEDVPDTKNEADDPTLLAEQSGEGGAAEVETPQRGEAEDNFDKHRSTDRSSEEKSAGGDDDAQDDTTAPPPKRRKGRDGKSVKTPVRARKGSKKPCGNPEQVEMLNNMDTLQDMLKLVAEHGKAEEDYKVGDAIEVDDLTQTGYKYRLEAPIGKNFAEGFNPAFTPKEMLAFGVYEGEVINDCIFEFPKEWYMEAIEKEKISMEGPDDSKNQFQVNSRVSSKESSRKRGWSPKDDPRGWFQWYCRYYLGRRVEPDDTNQMSRWRQMRRHAGQIKKSCAAGDLSCRVKQRQTLLNWSHDCFM